VLKTSVMHPEILAGLAASGHGGKIFISDGNYPHNTHANPRAKIVWANFTAGVLDAVTVLRLIVDLVPIEKVEVMVPQRTGESAMTGNPPIWKDFRKVLKDHSDFRGELTELEKYDFMNIAKGENVCLVIATAEKQIYADVMVTIGVIR
jgi:L-fucose mutarotase